MCVSGGAVLKNNSHYAKTPLPRAGGFSIKGRYTMASKGGRPRMTVTETHEGYVVRIIGTPQSASATRGRAGSKHEAGKAGLEQAIEEALTRAGLALPTPEGIKA